MSYAWIDEVQEYIDEVGVADFLGGMGVDNVWTSYESCLCQVNLEDVQEGEYVVTRIAAQGMLENVGYQAFLVNQSSGNYPLLELSDDIGSIEDGFLEISFNPDVAGLLLGEECAFLLTSDSPSEITALQVVRIEPDYAVLTFDMPAPSQPLPAPTGLTVTNITDSSCVISWDAVPNAISYEVVLAWWETNSHEASARSFSSATNQLSISGLTSVQEYAYVVRAIGDGTYYTNSDYAGVSSDSSDSVYVWHNSTLRFTTLKASSLSGVTVTFESATTVRVINNGSTIVFVLYAPASSALSKTVMTFTTVSGTARVQGNGSINIAILSTSSEIVLTYPADINIIGIYPYIGNSPTPSQWIQAVQQGAYTTANEFFYTSNNVYVYVRQNPLSTPTNLHATNITSTGATLHWDSVDNATDYKVEYRQSGATDWTED